MKKYIVVLMLVLALVSLSALALGEDTETTLWPAYDPITGLWGYITEDGAWGIEPQYTEAYHFHDGCAIVDMGEHVYARTPTQGIIDETGAFLLEPEYRVYCEHDFTYAAGEIFFVMDDEGRMGWFNIPNRYFSGLHWTECYAVSDTPYIQINMDYSVSGLADRATGEVVVPMIYSYTTLSDYGSESGFIVAERADSDGCELIEIGVGPVALPEGVYLDYAVGVVDSGLVTFCTEDDLQGYLNTSGEIVIDAQFWAAGEFRDGYAQVTLLDGTQAVIDRTGSVVLTGEMNYLGVVDGALFVEWPDDTWGLVETDGTVRCRHTLPEDVFMVSWLYEFSGEGPLWVEYSLGDDEYLWGLMSREGELLGEPRWSWVSSRAGEEWLAVCEGGSWVWSDYEGAWGYVDAWGNTVLPFTYKWAEPFDGPLAYVRFDESTEGYINRSGQVVYSWPVE